MTTVKKRYWMKIQTKRIETSIEKPFRVVPIAITNTKSLAQLMDRAYRDTIDYEGETLEQCHKEIADTINGKYGPLIEEASFAVSFGSELVSAILITEYKGLPLVAFTMTDPKFQRKGLSSFLLNQTISSLHALGRRELFLVVTEGNSSAERLYKSIGFKRIGPALPGTPPPATSK